MSSLKHIKAKIRSIDKTRQVTKAMEAVSAVKMRKSQAAAFATRPYALHALSILKRLSGSIDSVKHPLVAERPVKKTGFVVITSDRGLAGSLNSSVLREVHAFIREHGLAKDSIGLITIGRKAYDHFQRRGFTILGHFEHWGENVSLENPEPLTKIVTKLFLDGEYDAFYIAFSNFESTFRQHPLVRKLLPVKFEDVQKTVDAIIPAHGKYSELERRPHLADDHVREYVLEPSAESVLDELVPFMVNIQLFHSQLEANASEHSARMVAMKNASDKARDMSRELTLHYNKARQSAITREVSEIIGGIEAMS